MRYAIDNRPKKKMLLHHPTSTRDFWKSSLCTRFPPRHDYLPFFSPNKHRTGSGSLEIQIYTCKQHFSCLILVRSINFVKGRRRKEIKKYIFECHLIWQRWITFGCARQQPEDEREWRRRMSAAGLSLSIEIEIVWIHYWASLIVRVLQLKSLGPFKLPPGWISESGMPN